MIVRLFLLLSVLVSQLASGQAKHRFELGDSAFLLDGRPFQIISGEIHYPRVPREAWRHRMKMARAMGLNTIGTYVFWNLHEPEKGKFDFSGNNDIAEFVRIAAEEKLWVILRPSPYVCAEWEYGGYPYWLQNIKGLTVRSKDSAYLREYRKYIRAVGAQLAPLQVNRGGNILMVQVENEYGSYGSDKEYLEINRQLFVEAGFDGLLYTCDPASDLVKGMHPSLLPAVNGLDKPSAVKKLIRENHNGKGPFFIAEWYPAWFDWWGTPHHTVPAEKYAPALDSVLKAGISINMYMFHGGTTRGFMNGANRKQNVPYEPQISSYDYDAPLDEAGNATHKFMEFRKVIAKYLPVDEVLPSVPAARPTMSITKIALDKKASLVLPSPIRSTNTMSFEQLNQAYGYVLYRTYIGNGGEGYLNIDSLADFGIVYVDGKKMGTLDRRWHRDSIFLKLPKGRAKLEILIENMGRINYGKYMLQNTKGITKSASFNGRELKGWDMFRLPFSDIDSVKTSAAITNDLPLVRSGIFTVEDPADTYLDMSNWRKGVVWINGHNLGRYWSVGPQQTLYIPAEWLRKGKNRIQVLELTKEGRDFVSALDHPILNQLGAE